MAIGGDKVGAVGSWLAAVLAGVATIAACSSDDPAPFTPPEADVTAKPECKPQACSCPDGKQATRACVDGGYGECGPCDPPGPTCGDGTCNGTETCETCESDCGACALCDQAPSCKNATVPPVSSRRMTNLDVRFEAMPKDRILQDLRAELAGGSPRARVFAALLADGAAPGEHPAIAQVRAIMKSNPAFAKFRTAARRQLARAGVTSIADYRAKFPEPRRADTELASGLRFSPKAASPATHTPAAPSTPIGAPKDAGADAAKDSGIDSGADAGKLVDCGPPQLAVRIAKIKVYNPDDDFLLDNIYCNVTARSPKGEEIKVTPVTMGLDSGDSEDFDPADGTFWGQEAPRETGGDLRVQYRCWEQDDPKSYTAMLGALKDFANGVGKGYDSSGADGSGYVWTVVGIIDAFAPIIASLDSDDLLLVAQQVLPKEMHLELTRGGNWLVRKKGTHYNSDWDWELTIETWGCAKFGGL